MPGEDHPRIAEHLGDGDRGERLEEFMLNGAQILVHLMPPAVVVDAEVHPHTQEGRNDDHVEEVELEPKECHHSQGHDHPREERKDDQEGHLKGTGVEQNQGDHPQNSEEDQPRPFGGDDPENLRKERCLPYRPLHPGGKLQPV